ncbi:hypothetical protein [Gordonia sputi]|uniref:hypothetical protein n=1 Tax=Gordonia sputi TaxID=36823 RepID=UPI0036CF2071
MKVNDPEPEVEPFLLLGDARARMNVPPEVVNASRQWLAVHDAQTAASERRLGLVVLACRIAAAVVVVGASVVIAGATMTMPEGSPGAAFGVFVMMLLVLSVVVVVPTILFTALIKRSARLGRDASAGRMRYLETNFPGYYSCDFWERWHPNRTLALRGPRS